MTATVTYRISMIRWQLWLLALGLLCAAGCSASPTTSAGSVTSTSGAPSTVESTSAPTATTRPSVAPRSPVWPEGSTSAVTAAIPRLQAGQDPWRSSPDATAQMFAREILGWNSPQVEPDPTRRTDGSSLWFRVTGGSKRLTASVELIPLTDERRWWAVSYARLAGGDDLAFNVSVRVAGSLASVSAAEGWWTADVARAELRIGHGTRERTLVVNAAPARWNDFELPQPASDTGHLMLIFRSTDGQAVAILATGLPKGDFAAS